jgi:hypothetical protein
LDIPINPCVRTVCSRSVAVGLLFIGLAELSILNVRFPSAIVVKD